MKSFLKKHGRLCILAIPLVIGMIGFILVEKEAFLQSLFNSICMYFMNYQDVPPNMWVEAARWLAPLATASGVILVINTLRKNLRNLWLYCTKQAVVIYGEGDTADTIRNHIGKKAIQGEEEFIPAQEYYLLKEEKWNLDFYRKNQKALKNAVVYLKCQDLKSQSVADEQLYLFCPEEIAARVYWKEHCLYDLAKANDYRMKILFLGFGKLGEQLLVSGLQNNIFHPNQKIEYHIFGDGEEFSSTHTQMKSISDSVEFHKEKWYEDLALLEEADLVLILTQDKQIDLIQKLLFSTKRRGFNVFAEDIQMLSFLAENERLIIFDWMKESCRLEYLQGNTLYRRAKKINLRYAILYGNASDTKESMEAEWRSLNSFTRYSNISAADYHDVRLLMLEDMELDMELLAELEHIRWCRYHYLNNWIYGVPANGKAKDEVLRIHTDLKAYHKLSEEDKEKDRENIRIMMELE